jgi:hypothetical protein
MESLLLFRRALSSPTMCRFIPALSVPEKGVRLADHVLLFDNSLEQGYQLAGIISPPAVQWFDPLPA